jgi:hypothetical protein
MTSPRSYDRSTRPRQRPSNSRRCARSRRWNGRPSRPRLVRCISFGATLLGAFTGRKLISSGTLGRATTAMRDVSRSVDERGDVQRAEETLATVKQRQADLDAEFQAEVDALEAQIDPMTETLDKVLMRPRKSDIAVDSLGLVWIPYWQDATGSLMSAWG